MPRTTILVVISILTGCSHAGTTPLGAQCSTTSDCVAGAFCLSGKCTTCATQDCVNDTSGSGGSLSISSVHGDQATSDPSAPGGFWTTNGVVISGANFDSDPTKLSVVLTDVSGNMYGLMVNAASATTISATFPSTLLQSAIGMGTLSVIGSAGTASTSVQILQGPPGPTGPPGMVGMAGTNNSLPLSCPSAGLKIDTSQTAETVACLIAGDIPGGTATSAGLLVIGNAGGAIKPKSGVAATVVATSQGGAAIAGVDTTSGIGIWGVAATGGLGVFAQGAGDNSGGVFGTANGANATGVFGNGTGNGSVGVLATGTGAGSIGLLASASAGGIAILTGGQVAFGNAQVALPYTVRTMTSTKCSDQTTADAGQACALCNSNEVATGGGCNVANGGNAGSVGSSFPVDSTRAALTNGATLPTGGGWACFSNSSTSFTATTAWAMCLRAAP